MQHFNLYKGFAKKENSTKQPGSGTLTLGVQGIFKEPCSILNPVLKIERLALDAVPYDYNYARYIEGDRYYFIEDWVWADGLWEVHMKEDVLATFKTEIGATQEYILRTDSTTDFNGDITDTTYPATNNYTIEAYQMPNEFVTNITDGIYIVGIISGNTSNNVGAITYYAMDSYNFGQLNHALLSDDNLFTMGITDNQGVQLIQDISKQVLKTLYNPYQYIASCMWFPITMSALTSIVGVSNIPIGWWDYPLHANQLYAQIVQIGVHTAFTAHPQSASRGNYLNYAPYSRRTLIGRFGTVALDSANFVVGDDIFITYRIDLITGQCTAFFDKRDSNLSLKRFAERNFLLAVPIQIAQVGTDYLKTETGIINTAASIASGVLSGNAFGAIAGAANGIYNTIQAAMPQMETGGLNGSFLSVNHNTYIHNIFYNIVDEDIAHRGRPLCELRTINTLSGFILCAEGDMDISCYDNERKEIVKFLTTGFFWE